MSDRADELRRQRDLIREHLAWIERELAAEEGAPPTPPYAYAEPVAPLVRPPVIPAAPVDDRDAEAILAEYRTPAMSIAAKTKFGCVAYFVGAMLLLAAAVALFYFYVRSVRAH